MLLQEVGTSDKAVEGYKDIVDDGILETLHKTGRNLQGVHVCHVSSTPYGGGIAEMLYAVVPLERNLGLDVSWMALRGDERIYQTGKLIHNGLQGAAVEIDEATQRTYRDWNRLAVLELLPRKYDIVIVHTSSLLGIPCDCPDSNTRWIWRCHGETSHPDPSVWVFIKAITERYHGAVFTSRDFVPEGLNLPRVTSILPAIDPLSPKNRDLPIKQCREFAESFGISQDLPIVLHTSRLDQWQDPDGMIRSYYVAKDSVPDLQLVVITSLSLDDPDTFATLRIVDEEASKDEDIHVFTNMDGFGDLEVNAFQRVCCVGLHRSLREGFGMPVTEALWKGKPVIGSRASGIKALLTGKLEYCLTDTAEEAGTKLAMLLTDDSRAGELGEFGRKSVQSGFLITRLLGEELAFFESVLELSKAPSPDQATTKDVK